MQVSDSISLTANHSFLRENCAYFVSFLVTDPIGSRYANYIEFSYSDSDFTGAKIHLEDGTEIPADFYYREETQDYGVSFGTQELTVEEAISTYSIKACRAIFDIGDNAYTLHYLDSQSYQSVIGDSDNSLILYDGSVGATFGNIDSYTVVSEWLTNSVVSAAVQYFEVTGDPNVLVSQDFVIRSRYLANFITDLARFSPHASRFGIINNLSSTIHSTQVAPLLFTKEEFSEPDSLSDNLSYLRLEDLSFMLRPISWFGIEIATPLCKHFRGSFVSDPWLEPTSRVEHSVHNIGVPTCSSREIIESVNPPADAPYLALVLEDHMPCQGGENFSGCPSYEPENLLTTLVAESECGLYKLYRKRFNSSNQVLETYSSFVAFRVVKGDETVAEFTDVVSVYNPNNFTAPVLEWSTQEQIVWVFKYDNMISNQASLLDELRIVNA